MSEEHYVSRERMAEPGSLVDDGCSKKRETARSRMSKVPAIIGRSILFAIAFSVALVLCFRWVPPPTSAMMLERYFETLFHGPQPATIRYKWVDWKSISPQMALAVVAAEDQKFPHHWGFDFEAISEVVETSKHKGRPRGASTITQQVAKNLFLWSGRSYVRKALEAYFAVLLELLWSKQRILEVYLNIAEFGEGTYGVWAAAKTLLGKSPSELTRRDAALLAAVLPNPRRLKARHPSSYLVQRRYWIQRQMEQLGGTEYLKDL